MNSARKVRRLLSGHLELIRKRSLIGPSKGRAVTDISRHELFGLIADHPELVMSKDRVRDLADILGVKRLSQRVNEYLGNCLSTYFMR